MNIRYALLIALATLSCAAAAATPSAASLGLIVDSTSAQDAQAGLRVLGATPGSTADRIGLRPGDVLVDVNGTSLANLGSDADGHALAADTLNSTLAGLPASEPLRLRVLRGSATLAMNVSQQETADTPSDAPVTAADASGGCGRISTFDVAPRSQHLYRAKILLLDGVTPGPTGVPTFLVSAGTHKLLVAEDIPTEQMGVGDFASLRSQRNTNKELTVTVKPGMTSMLAARLNTDKAADFVNAAYWNPVIWREIPESCR